VNILQTRKRRNECPGRHDVARAETTLADLTTPREHPARRAAGPAASIPPHPIKNPSRPLGNGHPRLAARPQWLLNSSKLVTLGGHENRHVLIEIDRSDPIRRHRQPSLGLPDAATGMRILLLAAALLLRLGSGLAERTLGSRAGTALATAGDGCTTLTKNAGIAAKHDGRLRQSDDAEHGPQSISASGHDESSTAAGKVKGPWARIRFTNCSQRIARMSSEVGHRPRLPAP
jgi:hypothetical protein